MKTSAVALFRAGGFSLVEVTIAIGIFAFVVVGVVGLFPTALKMRQDASAETRAVMAAEEIFASIKAAPNLNNLVLRRGTKTEDVIRVNLTTGAVALGYSIQSSVPFFAWWPGSEKAEYKDAAKAWREGSSDAATQANSINALIFVSATNLPTNPNLYQVSVQVRSPASLPLDKARPVNFTSLVYSP